MLSQTKSMTSIHKCTYTLASLVSRKICLKREIKVMYFATWHYKIDKQSITLCIILCCFKYLKFVKKIYSQHIFCCLHEYSLAHSI